MSYQYDFTEYRYAEIDAYMQKERPAFTRDALCRGTIYKEIQEARTKFTLKNGVGEPLDISTTFFPSRGGASKVVKARKTCAQCPVRWECFEYGYDGREQAGIWGGSTVDQREECVRREMEAEEAFIFLFGQDCYNNLP